jgi:hypothetical protein
VIVVFLEAMFLAGAGQAGPSAITLTVTVDWSMDEPQQRFGHDSNANGIVDLPNTHEYVQGDAGEGGEARFPVRLELGVALPRSTIRNSVRVDTASWTLRRLGCTPRADVLCAASATGTMPQLSLPEGHYTATVTFTGRTYLGRPVAGRLTRRIRIEDFLIVSIGDSYASGEGNPERVLRPCCTAWDPMTRTNRRYRRIQNVYWADPGTSVDAAAAVSHRRFGASGAVFTQTVSMATSAVGRSHVRSHRSTLSASAQAALAIERSDPRSSVTFVSLAASGATIDRGLVGTYAGVDNEPDAKGPKMASQVDAAGRLVGERAVDALTVSIGGNDIGFGNAVAALILCCTLSTKGEIAAAVRSGNWNKVEESYVGRLPAVGYAYSNEPVGLDNLPQAYARLAERMQSLRPKGAPGIPVYITEYPDPTKWVSRAGKRHYCDDILDNVAPARIGAISEEEARFAYNHILVPLNNAVAAAAARHGWTYVSGIAGAFGDGHGLCADRPYDPSTYKGNPHPDEVAWPTGRHVRWLRVARESEIVQGPPEDRKSSKGTLHPNEFGHRAISERLKEAIRYRPQAPPTAVEIDVP